MRSVTRRSLRALSTAAVWLSVCSVGFVAPEAGPPNVLLVTIDTLRADHLGAYGYDRIETPRIDGLAKRGALFRQAFSVVPLTLPSHASIMTGQWPPTHGARNNGQRLPAGPATLAEILKGRGYRTGAFVGAFPLDSRFGLDRGFEAYDDRYGSRNAQRDLTFVERRADDVNEAALPWITARRGERFFAWVHYFDPHAPYEPPPPYGAGYRGREYDGEIAYVDAALGRLIAGLEKSGLLDNTLIVLTADHGESLGEHGEATHGIFIYDSALHVPLVIVHPRIVPAGRTIGAPVALSDIAPTVLELLRIPVPAAMQGLSLVPLLRGGIAAPDKRFTGRAIYQESLSGWLDRRWAPLRAVRTAEWKYIDAPQAELYDLASDPKETKNVLADRPEEARRLSADLGRLQATMPAGKASETPMSEETRRKLRSLGYVGGGSGPEPAKPPDPKAMMGLDALFNDAVLASEAGRLDEAEAQFQAALDKDPGFVQAYEYAAYNFYKMSRLDAAIGLLRKALSLDFRTAPLLARLGLYLQESGRIEESVAVLEEAAELGPDDAEVRNDLGVALFKSGRADRAAEEFQKAIGLDPSNAMAYNNLGNVRLALQAFEDAGAAFEKAVSFDPRLASAYNGWGAVAYRRGDVGEAVARWERAIGLDPKQPDALYNLGRAYLRQDRKKDALRIFEEFIRWAPAERRYAKDIAEVKAVVEKLKKEIGGSACP